MENWRYCTSRKQIYSKEEVSKDLRFVLRDDSQSSVSQNDTMSLVPILQPQPRLKVFLNSPHLHNQTRGCLAMWSSILISRRWKLNDRDDVITRVTKRRHVLTIIVCARVSTCGSRSEGPSLIKLRRINNVLCNRDRLQHCKGPLQLNGIEPNRNETSAAAHI